jgi:hypothetical protein
MVHSYSEFHAYFTLPVFAVVAFFYRSFYTYPVDTFRVLFLTTGALVWTAPWANWMSSRDAWQYCEKCTKWGCIPSETYISVSSWKLCEVAFFIDQL